MSIETILQQEARLVILKELSQQGNKALSSESMRRYLLSGFVMDKPREWIEQQFRYLADMGAVEIIPAATVQIARLTERGEQFLSGQVVIAGIQRPSGGV